MNNEIKEILDRIETASEIFDCLLKPEECTELLDYITNLEDTLIDKQECIDAYNEIINNRDKEITNLQQEIQEANDSITWWTNRFRAVERENKRLKGELNCKEYFSSIMSEDTEFVILTKNNYDRQQKDIELELIDYKSRLEKANNQLKIIMQIIKEQPTRNIEDDEWLENRLIGVTNILQNGSDDDV